MPAAWMTGEMYPLLVGYCRVVDYAAQHAQWLDENPIGKVKGSAARQHRSILNGFLALQKQIASLGTKLRLTPQARYLPKYASASTAKREADAGLRTGRRPWEIYDEEPGNA